MSDILALEKLTMRVMAGASIDAAIQEAKVMARECPVEFRFNETTVTVWHPNQPAAEIIDWYNRRRSNNA